MAHRYRIKILPSALREIKGIPRPQQKSVRKRINDLADDPRPIGCDVLSGAPQERIHRVRQGDWRILYQVFDQELRVLVVRVADRKEIYSDTMMKQFKERLRAALAK
ncbi:MAG: type II toxin-antitoxin system RelE/ParE family toxin [Chloroflexi bacterium]|nr:type II toxin-antitoxin system RelE/ParE family toxin [Chloroflexota bacterium]